MHTLKGLVALLAVGLLAGPMAASAAPVTYAYTGVVFSVDGATGTAVGNAVSGLFTYDPVNYSEVVAFTANTGSFSLTEAAYFGLVDNPSFDQQFIEGVGTTQFGLFFGESSGSAISGTAASDLNFNLADWEFAEVRYNVFDGSVLVRGWTGELTSLTIAPVPLPAAAWLLLTGLGGLGFIGRRRKAA